jgi:hypothetical protein
MSGTSMAAPQAAGVAALIKAAAPGVSFAQARTMLLAGADMKPGLTGKVATGGRLNAAASLAFALGAHLRPGALTVVDDPGLGAVGNDDGIASPGETVLLEIPVENIGAEACQAVTGALSMPHPPSGLTLVQSAVSYGNVAAGAEVSGTPLFSVQVDPSFEPADVELLLTLTDEEGRAWTGSLVLKVRTVEWISGTVTQVSGGAPLEGAVVRASGVETYSTETGPDGAYQLAVINGEYSVTASKAGFNTSAALPVSVPPGQSGVDFALGAASGIVTPGSLAVEGTQDQEIPRVITIHNTGDQPLEWRIEQRPAAPVMAAALRPPVIAAAAPVVPTPEELARPPAGAARRFQLQRSLTRDASTSMLTTLPFRDGFEEGMWGRWWEGWGDGTREVVSTTAAEGAQSFRFYFDGPDDHFTGIHQFFQNHTRPGYVSFWTRPGPVDAATSFMVLLDVNQVDGGAGPGVEVAELIWFHANVNGRFYINDDVGGNQAVRFTEGEWYWIEFRNMDWDAKRFDYWVNGELVQEGVPFRNPDKVQSVAYAFTYNHTAGTEMGLDDARFYQDALPWLGMSEKSGVIPPGQSAEVTVLFSSFNLEAGLHEGTLAVRMNDPDNPVATIPVSFEVEALPNQPPVAISQHFTLGFAVRQPITLQASDPDGDPLVLRVIGLPERGTLHQTTDGVTPGAAILHTPRVVSDPLGRLVFVPAPGGVGEPYATAVFDAVDPRGARSQATLSFDVLANAVLIIDPPGATSDTPVEVSIICPDPNAVIRLSLDGSDPMDSDLILTGENTLLVDRSLTLSGVAVDSEGTVSSVQSYEFVISDSNENGIPDWWEAMFGGFLEPEDDEDLDGVSNFTEFLMGTNPFEQDQLELVINLSGPLGVLSWDSLQSRIYEVMHSQNSKSWTSLSGPMVGSGAVMSFVDPNPVPPPPARRFYQLRVRMH